MTITFNPKSFLKQSTKLWIAISFCASAKTYSEQILSQVGRHSMWWMQNCNPSGPQLYTGLWYPARAPYIYRQGRRLLPALADLCRGREVGADERDRHPGITSQLFAKVKEDGEKGYIQGNWIIGRWCDWFIFSPGGMTNRQVLLTQSCWHKWWFGTEVNGGPAASSWSACWWCSWTDTTAIPWVSPRNQDKIQMT